MKKKISIMALCFVFILSYFSMTVFAADKVYTYNYFNYQVDSKSVIITNYFGTDSVVTVPSMIAGNPVSKIATGAFTDCDTVTQINLPDTIMEVETGAIGAGISVLYNSNTDNPVGEVPETEVSGEEEKSNTSEDQEVNGAGSPKQDVEEENSQDSSGTNDSATVNDEISFGEAGGEITADEVEQLIQKQKENKSADKEEIVQDEKTNELSESVTESEPTLSAETEITEVAESQSETEAMTESELESETEEAADSGKDFTFAVATVAVIAVLAVVCIVWRRKK